MKKFKAIFIMVICMLLLAACSKDTKQPEQTSEDANKQQEQSSEDSNKQEEQSTEDSDKQEEQTTEDKDNQAEQAKEKIDINIGALKGPTAIGMVKVREDSEAGQTANNYNFTIAGTADELSTGLVKGEIDIAAIPCNLASVLYNKTEGQIKLAGINTLGVLYIVETGDSIQSVEDLKGKTIYSTGLGTTPQFTLNYLLTSHGIDPEKDLTIDYKAEATEVAAILSENKNAIAMLPQPYVTTVLMKNSNLRIALDVAKEWEAVSTDGSSVVTGVVVVRSKFLEENKEAFDTFMEEYKASAVYANESIEETAALCEKYEIFQAAPLKTAIPYCNITLIQGTEMKEKVNGYLTVLFNQEPKSVGGKLPGDDFYYIAEK